MTQKNTKTGMKLFGSRTNFHIKKWYKNLTVIDKRILFGFLGLFLLIMLFNLSIEIYRQFDSDLTQQECNQLRADDTRYALQLQEDNQWLAFIYSFQLSFKLLLGAIAVGWILHGVGFKIIGR